MKKNNILTIVFITVLSIVPLAAFAQESLNPLIEKSAPVQWLKVDRVRSTDTLVLDNGQKVQLIGLNAIDVPQRKDVKRNSYNIIIEEVDPVATLEEQGMDFVNSLLTGEKVRIELDAQTRNDDGIMLAYVFLEDGTFVNEKILSEGYAAFKTIPPNTKYEDVLRRAYQQARSEKRGIHGE
ncbi:MAG: thermonuclease family protein [Candidatus Omnitrophota bacterium]